MMVICYTPECVAMYTKGAHSIAQYARAYHFHYSDHNNYAQSTVYAQYARAYHFQYSDQYSYL